MKQFAKIACIVFLYASVGFFKLALITVGVALPAILAVKLIRKTGENV